MWEPSWSWSVIIIRWPYRRPLVSWYTWAPTQQQRRRKGGGLLVPTALEHPWEVHASATWTGLPSFLLLIIPPTARRGGGGGGRGGRGGGGGGGGACSPSAAHSSNSQRDRVSCELSFTQDPAELPALSGRCPQRRPYLSVLKAEDLLDVVDLGVAHDLSVGCIAHVEELSPAPHRIRTLQRPAGPTATKNCPEPHPALSPKAHTHTHTHTHTQAQSLTSEGKRRSCLGQRHSAH